MSISETVWNLEPHTAKKHEILRRYFQAWLPILAQSNERLLYVDAFAGPGEYSKGEDGSPLVILKAARDHVLKFTSELLCLFVENDVARYNHLEKVLDGIKATLPANIKFRPLQGTFNEQLTEILVKMDEQRKNRAPTLAFLDPFGFSQIPFKTVVRLMRYPKCEVLLNVMYEEINRFLSVPELAEHFDSLFGTGEWREIVKITDPIARFRGLHDLYLKQLKTVAKYARSFLMVNKSNTPDYLLFFATNNPSGLKKMKHAMWKVDPTGEFQFSDYTDAKRQLPLAFATEPDFDWLRDIVSYEFSHAEISVDLLEEWVLAETPFLDTHIRKQVLTPREKAKTVSVVNPKPGRRPYTYPKGTIVKFH